ncbi:hypothetical protein Hsero_4226 [Herbaspirillum seropedicae SmR1]|uniref:Uncharacterized protein n=1 Tax=Herbaspirillum seropedicae (strain SmR1) TaxID=757424 RepID=D8IUG3_HERSS|nr:hypothetical protein Hsero_4226 [Herbaspirillum seropedicae SmR1]
MESRRETRRRVPCLRATRAARTTGRGRAGPRRTGQVVCLGHACRIQLPVRYLSPAFGECLYKSSPSERTGIGSCRGGAAYHARISVTIADIPHSRPPARLFPAREFPDSHKAMAG